MRKAMDLLPRPRAARVMRSYFLRLATVATLAVSAALAVHAVLLLPSYLHVRFEVEERERALSELEASLAGGQDQGIKERSERLAKDAAYFSGLAGLPKASRAVAAVIAVPRPGVTLEGFSFAPGERGASMTVSGRAASREALRAFESRLESEPYVESAELPISAYAAETDIEFSILLTGPFLP